MALTGDLRSIPNGSFYCAPQGPKRTAVEEVLFDRILSRCNLLYLTMSVFIIADDADVTDEEGKVASSIGCTFIQPPTLA